MTGSNKNDSEWVVRNQLVRLANDSSKDVQSTMIHYANERFLYRIGVSTYANRLILKGANLFRIWTSAEIRPTRDLDFLGFGEMTLEDAESIVKSLCALDLPGETGEVEKEIRISEFLKFSRNTKRALIKHLQRTWNGIQWKEDLPVALDVRHQVTVLTETNGRRW